MEKPIRALEVTLGSSTDMNLGYNNTKFYNNVWGNLDTSILIRPKPFFCGLRREMQINARACVAPESKIEGILESHFLVK
jgi:hypothetical protein